ncbi:MAG: hypothetical protein WCW52_07235 [Elusimicrobiales bacterium]|jgi:hypothetical protein
MIKRDLTTYLLVEALKTTIVLFTLLLMGRFIETLPFAVLPVFNKLVTADELIAAFISAAAIAVFIKAGSNAKTAVDELLPQLPGAGKLLNYVTGIVALLFAYAAFQPVVFPFIPEFEWVYQSLFLAATLFLLAKAALHVYGASESLSRFLVSVLQSGKQVPPGPGPENK